MKRTVLASAIVVALFGFGASPAFADANPTTTEAAAPIPEGPSAGASGAGSSTAPAPDQLSGPSSNGAAEAVLPPDSTTPTELRPDYGAADPGTASKGSSNNGTSSNGSPTGAKPGAGTGDSAPASGSGHNSSSTTRAGTDSTGHTGGSASKRSATSASAGSDSTNAPNGGPSASESSASVGAGASVGANSSTGTEGPAAADKATDANGTGTNDDGTTASGDGTDGASTAGDPDTADSDSDEPAQIDASVTVSPDEITESDLYFEGITVTVSGVEPGDRVTNSLDNEVAVARSSTVEFMYLPEDFVEPGIVDFTITVAREGVADQVIDSEFTVVSDSDAVEGTLTMSATRMSISDFTDKGIDFTAEPFAQESPILGFAFSDDSEDPLYFDGGLAADSSGRVSGTITANDDAEPVPGDYHLFVISDGAEAWADFTLTEDAAPAESTDPTEPTKPGAETTESKATALPHTQGESPSRGTTSAHWSRAGSAWSESEEEASESASLPRTGAELGSLGVGGALLIAGAVIVAITARRRSEPK